jgi:hypothetical protein
VPDSIGSHAPQVSPSAAKGALAPLWGTATGPWAIFRRHPLGPEVAQETVTPWFVSGAENMDSGHETPVQTADWPESKQSPLCAVTTTQLLGMVCGQSLQTELLRRAIGVRRRGRDESAG